MKRVLAVVGSLSLVGLVLPLPASPSLAARTAGAPAPGSQAGAPGDAMLQAWDALVASLDEPATERSSFPFDSDHRTEWYYTPVERQGLPLGAMDEDQEALAWEFLNTGLGPEGAEKARGVIVLEELLYERSGGRAMRDPGNYFISVFGAPAASGAWGWRFEGHHLSVSFTLRDGRVVATTPAFFGANPAEVREGPRAGLRIMAAEEETARELVRSFSGELRERVLVAAEAPSDVLTGNSPTAEMGAPDGVALETMDEEQQALFLELLGIYARRLHPDLADRQLADIRAGGIERVHFAWAGSTEPGEPHYYRVHGPTFIIEWDNTQGGANHVHSVWRDFDDDFGGDPLREHLAADHGLRVEGIGAATRATDAVAPGSADGRASADPDAGTLHRELHASGIPHAHR